MKHRYEGGERKKKRKSLSVCSPHSQHFEWGPDFQWQQKKLLQGCYETQHVVVAGFFFFFCCCCFRASEGAREIKRHAQHFSGASQSKERTAVSRIMKVDSTEAGSFSLWQRERDHQVFSKTGETKRTDPGTPPLRISIHGSREELLLCLHGYHRFWGMFPHLHLGKYVGSLRALQNVRPRQQQIDVCVALIAPWVDPL